MPLRFRPNVLQMQGYPAGKTLDELKVELGVDRIVRLTNNENAWGPSPRAIEAIRNGATETNFYPDAYGTSLKLAIERKIGVPSRNIVLGNGSDDIIHLLGLVMLRDSNDEIVVGDPSFARYEATAKLAGCKCILVRLDEGYRIDLSAMAKAVTERTQIVWLANPNNPTGTTVTKNELRDFMRDLPDHVLVVHDEAYAEYAIGVDNYPTVVEDVLEGRNVIGLRTFSKGYALAALRIGYGYGPEALIDAIDRVREPYNTSHIAQNAAIAALNDDEHLASTVLKNKEAQNRIAGILRRFGADAIVGYANFVWADLKRPAQPIIEALAQRGVLVKSGEPQGCPTCIRVGVAQPHDLDLFEAALNAVLLEKTPV